jgi:hypothetical protein
MLKHGTRTLIIMAGITCNRKTVSVSNEEVRHEYQANTNSGIQGVEEFY